MTALRAKTAATALTATLAAAAGTLLPVATAQAQIADEVVLSIMRECARIDDASARLACYDNNIRSAGTARNTVPGEVQAQGGPAPGAGMVTTSRSVPGGFGGESVRTPERFNTPPGQLEEVTAVVASIRQREPGIYAITLEDGAEWVFVDGVDFNYSLPRRGSRIEIRRGAIDSFLMRYNNQISVRVRRVR